MSATPSDAAAGAAGEGGARPRVRVRAGARAEAGTPASRAEAAKVARLLGLHDTAPVAYLNAVPAKQLVAYREALIDALYDEGREQLVRAAEASRLLPARLVAKVGERALGALVCARLAGLLDPRRAAEVSEHFSLGFLAQLAAELDPRRAVAVVTQLPGERVVAIALEMAARGETVAMGRFVAHLDAPTLAACVAELSDEDVVRVSFVAEGAKVQARIFDAAGAERMSAALDAARIAGLHVEAEFFLERLGAARRKRLGSMPAAKAS